MEPIELTDPTQVQEFLSEISLAGRGFCTDCLLIDAMDAGITDPDYLKAHGEDPHAHYKGKPNAWAIYHIRQGKKVFMVYGGHNVERRCQYTETP